MSRANAVIGASLAVAAIVGVGALWQRQLRVQEEQLRLLQAEQESRKDEYRKEAQRRADEQATKDAERKADCSYLSRLLKDSVDAARAMADASQETLTCVNKQLARLQQIEAGRRVTGPPVYCQAYDKIEKFREEEYNKVKAREEKGYDDFRAKYPLAKDSIVAVCGDVNTDDGPRDGAVPIPGVPTP